jgi:hypothetical protein
MTSARICDPRQGKITAGDDADEELQTQTQALKLQVLCCECPGKK